MINLVANGLTPAQIVQEIPNLDATRPFTSAGWTFGQLGEIPAARKALEVLLAQKPACATGFADPAGAPHPHQS